MSINNLISFLKNFINRTTLFRKRNFLNNYEVKQFLTPNYWSNSNQYMKFKLLFGQVKLIASKPDETTYNQYISKKPYGSDKFLNLIQFSGAWEKANQEQRQNILVISKYYNSKVFSFEQEGLFGQAFLNGENPYALERVKFDLNNEYLKQILSTFKKCDKKGINTNGLEFSIDLRNLQKQILKSDSQIYVINYDHLRRLYKNRDQPFENPNKYEAKTYTQLPYAIFINAKFQEKTRFICLCAAFKYTIDNNILVVSPYLQNVPYQLWNIARMHIALPHLNDFAIRIHLGRIHMAAAQFNVPLYNIYNQYYSNHNIRSFLNHTYLPFNNGLQGINLNTTSLLIPPVDGAIQQRIFNRTDAVELLINDFSTFSFNTYCPAELIKAQGIEKLVQNGSALYFDQKLYNIFSEFIESVYNHYNMESYEKLILDQVKNQVKNEIPIINLKNFIKNLAYTWVINHAHTKACNSYPLYYKYRPIVLIKALPNTLTPSSNDLILDSYLPNYEQQISSIVLALIIAVRDTDNYVLQRFIQKEKLETDYAVRQFYKKAIKSLHQFQIQLIAVNEERLADGKFKMDWLKPSGMQLSTNI